MSKLVIVGGPNGAGKTTAAMHILPSLVECKEYVNADEIAAGISPFNPDSLMIEASRLALGRIANLADSGVDFAFESTLASLSLGKIIETVRARNYTIDIAFIWIDNAEMAVDRVRRRVEAGGHFIPEAVVRRRYWRSCDNFYLRYRHLADDWYFFDNSASSTIMVAECKCNGRIEVFDSTAWESFIAGRERE